MPADSAPDARLDDLRRRWQAEPGSRLFLQLAEEYRRAGRHGEAVEVLEKGLEQHPSHVSARVALGRVRLEMGEPGNAAKELERALELDVTNLVANKLLIEAYLGRGERERARQRLDIYRLLNDSDPDLADLRRRIDGGGRPAPPASEPPPPPPGSEDTAAGIAGSHETVSQEPAEPGEEALAEGWAWGGEATAESLEPPPAAAAADTGAAAAADELGNDREEGAMTTRTGAERGGQGNGSGSAGEPFGDLAAGGAATRYLQGLTAEGLFALPAARGAEEAEAVSASPVASAPLAAPPAADAPPETLPEPRPAEVEALAEPVPAAPAARPSRDEAERPTVTLGQLYLDQGHFRQARDVFRALLDDDPDHAVARRGLDRAERELAAAGPEPVTAAELLREAEPGPPARRAVLGAYLSRILRSRESRPADVPR